MKRCHAKDSADALCIEIQQSQDTSWKHMFNTSWTTKRKQQQHPVVSYLEPAIAIYPVASYSGSIREIQCYCISSRHGIPDARKEEVAKNGKQTQYIQS
ncbi:BEACH domain-containing protein lvsC [Dorcoceras hygrometricum]|uniref:BEACH domain-containing protein lvsC n=1 Tax=Dorcoceras hygrometricum TaxID=472368 RepID=A0A2Z7DB16_9LAMI|nr:BEACH domain-containing protein lvsC [Dorcoceras hygrometricum]